TMRAKVDFWLKRKLVSYYLICATFIPTRRIDSVSKEAYFTILGVKREMTREVISVVNHPTESPSFWHDIFKDLKYRGVQEIDLVLSDGLQGIETVI
ncbi:MAG: transposase, partial [Bacteroidales bacterium]